MSTRPSSGRDRPRLRGPAAGDLVRRGRPDRRGHRRLPAARRRTERRLARRSTTSPTSASPPRWAAACRVVAPGRRPASPRPTPSSCASRRRSRRPRTRTSRRSCPPPRRSASTCGPGQLVILQSTTFPGTTTGPFREVLERSGLDRRHRLRPRLRARAGEPGRPGERQQGRPAPRRRDDPEAGTERAAALLRNINDHVVTTVVAGRRRARQAARERLPQRQHRLRQPAGPAVRADGPRRLGGHRRRGDQAVRVHALHARARASAATASRSTRTTWPGGPASSTSSTASSSSPATSTSRCRATSSTSSPRRSTTAAGRSRAPGSGVLGVAFKPNVRDARNSPAADVIAGSPRAAPTCRFHDPHVPDVHATPDGRPRGHGSARRRSSAGPTSSSS